ncbi:alpha/beta-hydrolase [Melanomma pulvis-pyrius CBS 109.77]|uniref:Alpha/beta-hydrolase n=1 Tax=Melanomma pulvis-pyrius CBS 109.77 TaxID=1314802 RepID=A0A6A6WTX7_9PLEO|nr:alpha/beta-hydrolase [Melanomma pulvis-pyrius CBS 109.77]
MFQKDYAFKTVGEGQSAEVTVYWSQNNPAKARPIALAFHGGGFVIGSRFMISSQPISDLVDAGFVFVSADYSLCPQVSLYNGPEQDAKDAYRWCKQELPSLLAKEGVAVDKTKVVALGYSAGATLALCLGGETDPPAAILDFYGAKLFHNSFWSSPLPALAKLPTLDDTFLNQIFDEPVLTSTATSLESTARPVVDEDKPKKGLPPPDLSKPRNAWLFSAFKDGTHLSKIVQDDDFDRVDPVNSFSRVFPPTFFVHGLADSLIIPDISKEALRRLMEHGVETGIALVPEASHGFDLGLRPEDSQYEYVKQGIEFLKRHV